MSVFTSVILSHLSVNLQRVLVQSVPSQTNDRIMVIGVKKDKWEGPCPIWWAAQAAQSFA